MTRIEINVAQLAGSVVENAAHYHGDKQLHKIIVNLAHNYIGCNNNINLLTQDGQFGTPLNGGEDNGPSYQIKTMLSPLTRLIFHPYDDPS